MTPVVRTYTGFYNLKAKSKGAGETIRYLLYDKFDRLL